MNQNTIDALRISNLHYASGYWSNSKVPVFLSNSKIHLVPPSINTGVFDPETGLYYPISYDHPVQGIVQNIMDNGVAVVSMQPMEFAQRDQRDYINQSNEPENSKVGFIAVQFEKYEYFNCDYKNLF